MIITTRLSAGSYVARAKGQKATASSAESARRAAENLATKLGHNPDLVELEGEAGGVCTFSLPEVTDVE
ncbi:TPA: hypothetical protein L4W52_000376 [Pseudomonas aeruginosa]|nr:hypothetical protein [Pseudomonas aeruginosa]